MSSNSSSAAMIDVRRVAEMGIRRVRAQARQLNARVLCLALGERVGANHLLERQRRRLLHRG
jgi:hypothetical protein